MASKQHPAVLLAAYAVLLALAAPLLAGDPDMLQDLCVADYKSLDGPLRLNGYPCKRPESTMANDFFSDVLSVPGSTGGNPSGSVVTAATVDKVPGLNTMGVSMSRIDYAPWGANPPHTHPRASELLFVLEGSLDVGFITSTGKFIARTVCKGEMFVFPRGLVHFQKNNNGSPAAAISAFNSQLPGTQKLAEALYTASPPVPSDMLARALDVDDCMVEPCVI
ncbi:germin-like protein 1-3 [Triticum urartu]|nr:germin-like protein 1-3 [Triticum urartu]